jgi:acetyltransferase-like isoleucine patch superfamily enzyme
MRNFMQYPLAGNRIVLVGRNGRRRENPRFIRGLTFFFAGNNNYVEIHEPFTFEDVSIHLSANTRVTIGAGSFLGKVSIEKMNGSAENRVIIGENFYFREGVLSVSSNGGDLFIGDHCMFSWDIVIRTSDGHAIIDRETGAVINEGREVRIDNHVWVSMGAIILKNAHIPGDCIVGAGAVVAGKFTETHAVIAGNPARIVKRNVEWKKEFSGNYGRLLGTIK